jgi:hypothetical protein
MRGPLRQRVNRRLLAIALAAAALGSTALGCVSGALVLQTTYQELDKESLGNAGLSSVVAQKIG